MPLREYWCEACQAVEERYVKLRDAPTPTCPVCLGPRTTLASRFGVVFTGPLAARYNDPKKENAHQEGFWAYRKNTASGQPEPTFIETWAELRAYRKSEGLDGDVPTHATISQDGRTINSSGMPGQWSGGMPEMPTRLRELVEKPIEEFHSPACTAAPSMPIDHGISVGAVDPAEVAHV